MTPTQATVATTATRATLAMTATPTAATAGTTATPPTADARSRYGGLHGQFPGRPVRRRRWRGFRPPLPGNSDRPCTAVQLREAGDGVRRHAGRRPDQGRLRRSAGAEGSLCTR